MRRIITFTASILALGVISFGMYAWPYEHRRHVLEIYCYALDKTGASPGDLAVIIRTPNGRVILLDGGKSNSIIPHITSVLPFYRRTIDVVISSNPDDGDVTGLVGVVNRYTVEQIVEPLGVIFATSTSHVELENTIKARNINHTSVSAGTPLNFDDQNLSAVVFFPPPATSTDFEFSKSNPSVLAFALRYGSTTFVFGGDITKKEQAYLAGQISAYAGYFGNDSHVMLVLPRAENVGTVDENFLAALAPEAVVVLKKPFSATKLAQKHPSKKPPEAVFSISSVSGLSVVNLAAIGDTEFISDGKSFTEKGLK